MVDNFFFLHPDYYEVVFENDFDREYMSIFRKDKNFRIIEGETVFSKKMYIIINGKATDLYEKCDIRSDIKLGGRRVVVYMKDVSAYAKSKLRYEI